MIFPDNLRHSRKAHGPRARRVAPFPARALLASRAFPGRYAPVGRGARRFVNGGVSAHVPVLNRVGA